jgi:hypothetical protein
MSSDDRDVLRLNERAFQLYQAQRFDEALEVAREAYRLARVHLREDDPELAAALNNLVELHRVRCTGATIFDAIESTLRDSVRQGDRSDPRRLRARHPLRPGGDQAAVPARSRALACACTRSRPLA